MKGYIKGKFNLICFLLGHNENEELDWGYCWRCKKNYCDDGWCKTLSHYWYSFKKLVKSISIKSQQDELPF